MALGSYAYWFSTGSFVTLMEKLLWAIALDMALVVAAIRVTMTSSSDNTSSIVEACVAGEQDYQNLYVLSFIAAAVAVLQSLAALLVPVVVGGTKKIEEVPHESSRIAMFATTLSHAATSICLVWTWNTLISIRVVKFRCLGGRIRAIVIAGDLVGALFGLVFTVVGCYVAMYAQ